MRTLKLSEKVLSVVPTPYLAGHTTANQAPIVTIQESHEAFRTVSNPTVPLRTTWLISFGIRHLAT